MDDIQATKTCRVCKTTKPVEEFSLRQGSSDGRRTDCKKCVSKRATAYNASPEGKVKHKIAVAKYNSRPEIVAKKKAQTRKYLASCDGKAKAKASAVKRSLLPEVKAKNRTKAFRYYATPQGKAKADASAAKRPSTPQGKAKRKLSSARYYARPEVKEKRRAYNIKRYASAAGKAVSQKAAAKYLANPINRANRKLGKARYKASPAGLAKGLASTNKRRAIKEGASIGDLEQIAAWEATWRTAKAVACHWCKNLFPGKECHADHVIALTKGGAHSVENLVPACPTCNGKKGAKRPEAFNAELEQPLLFY